MENLIKIKKKYLIFREEAKKISKSVQNGHTDIRARSFVLDFSQVEFMSRSFIDEFLNIWNSIENSGGKVIIVNLKPALRDFMEHINKKKKTIRSEIAAYS